MNLSKQNSMTVAVYLYLNIILSLSLILLNPSQVSNLRYLIYIVMFVVSVMKNKLFFSTKYIYVVLSISILMFSNLLLVSYKNFVLTEIISILLISLVPMYLFSTNKIDFDYLAVYWHKIARYLTFLLPLYLVLYFNNTLGYWHIGDYTNMNIMIFVYYYFIKKENQKSNMTFLLINIIVGLFFGSRSAIAGAIVTSIVLVLILSKGKKAKYYVKVIFSGLSILIVTLNLSEILNNLQILLTRLNLNSRNIELFIRQLKGGDLTTILSGREGIYEIVTSFIKDRDGFPGGLSTTRYITNGAYYHAHNVLLDLLSVFGVIGTFLFFSWYILKFITIFKTRKKMFARYSIFLILSISFWIASFTNAYFLNDVYFMCSISILIFAKNSSLRTDDFPIV